MNNTAKQILEFLQGEGELLTVTHFSPDGDAIGSMIAFGGMLDQLGIRHKLVIDDNIPQKYGFLDGFEKIENISQWAEYKKFSRLVILDAGALPRIGVARKCIGSGTKVLNIDHHFSGPQYGDLNLINVNASATCEILYDLFIDLGITISQHIAYGLFVGILTDTGRFRFSNTTAHAFEICSDLISKGVDPGTVTENIYYNLPIKSVRSLAGVLSTLELHLGDLVSFIYLMDEDEILDTEGFVEYASSINGVALAAFMRKLNENDYKVSLRSRCNVDVAEVAGKFAGGGHIKAAGFRYRGSLEDLKRNLLDEFKWQIKIKKIDSGFSFASEVQNPGDEY